MAVGQDQGDPDSASDALSLSMLVVQPVQLAGVTLDQAIVDAVDLARLDRWPDPEPSAPAPAGTPRWSDWASTRAFVNHFLTAFRVLEYQGPEQRAGFVDTLRRDYRGPDADGVARALRWIESRLVFDYRLNAFVIVHELSFGFVDEAALIALLAAPADGADFFNGLRSLFVAEDAATEATTSAYVQHGNRHFCATARRALRDLLGVAAAADTVIVPPRSGNISFVVARLDDTLLAPATRERLAEANEAAERVTKARRIDLDNGDMFVFGGRFHTIAPTKRARINRYMLLQFHMQYFWFYIHQLHGLIYRVQTSLVVRKTGRERDAIIPLARALMVKSQLIASHREGLRAYLEADANALYGAVESQWSINQGMAQIEESTTFLRDMFDHRNNEQRNRMADRIGFVLLAISLLQLVGLLSFWREYIEMTAPDFASTSPVAMMLGDPDHQRFAYLLFPIILVGVAVVGTLLYLRSRRRD